MPYSRYVAPHSIQEAVTLLVAEPNARPIAGGTDLLPRLRAGGGASELLVDLRRLPLREIVSTPEGLRIGACATHAQIAAADAIRRFFPALASACRQVGGPPIRNRGTIGGNLANASPAADSAPALLVYDAEVVVAGVQGRRIVPLNEFFLGPGLATLAPGDILTEIRLPWPPAHTAAAYLKLGRRRAMAVAVAGAAARLTLAQDGRVGVARVALGSVAPVPLRAIAAEALLLHLDVLAGPDFAEAARAAAAACTPISDLRASAEYRSRMAEVLARRALVEVCATLAAGVVDASD